MEQNAARESAFQVLSNLQGELGDKVGSALKLAASVRDDLIGGHPTSKVTVEKAPSVQFQGAVGDLIGTSRRTLEGAYELISIIEELRSEIPRGDAPKMERTR